MLMRDLFNLFRRLNRSLNKETVLQPDWSKGSSVEFNREKVDPMEIDTALSGWFIEETDELIKGFKIISQDVVLDVGCGDSPVLHFCAMRGAEIIFADIDQKKIADMVHLLEGTPARSVKGFVCDACQLPVKDTVAEKIIATEIMEHVDDPVALMNELVRVGKPGAQYLISAPDPVSEHLQKDIAAPAHFEKPNHIRIIEREAFEQLILDAGLIIEQRKYYGYFWSIWWILFWTCKQDLHPPWHPILQSWTQTWELLLKTEQGPKVKEILDNFMPKSQAIIARKPFT